jgi:hypothetical protein
MEKGACPVEGRLDGEVNVGGKTLGCCVDERREEMRNIQTS